MRSDRLTLRGRTLRINLQNRIDCIVERSNDSVRELEGYRD